MMTRELDELDAIHHSATSAPWDDEWEIMEEPDEYGYYPQREVRAEKDGMHLATFAYLQHLELFLAALKLPRLTAELRTLRDLANAARERRSVSTCEWCYDRECTGSGICPCDYACHDAEYRADMAVAAALARLDGEDTG